MNTTMTSDQDLKDLEYIAGLSNDFAQSLVSQYKSKQQLSGKQWFWVRKLANDNRNRREIEPDTRVVAIAALIRVAIEAGMERPKMKYKGVRIDRFSPRSKYRGQLRVMYEGAYAGRIDMQGNAFIYSKDVPIDDVIAILNDFNEDPRSKAATQGRLTGECCFCGHELSTKESVGMGYGPICADRYGLPWGSTQEYDDAKSFFERQ